MKKKILFTLTLLMIHLGTYPTPFMREKINQQELTKEITEELFAEIYRRYSDHEDPIAKFLHDIDEEEKQLKYYQKWYKVYDFLPGIVRVIIFLPVLVRLPNGDEDMDIFKTIPERLKRICKLREIVLVVQQHKNEKIKMR